MLEYLVHHLFLLNIAMDLGFSKKHFIKNQNITGDNIPGLVQCRDACVEGLSE
jgi:hypothetical protein